MDPNLDHANICPACGRLCGFAKRFCNDDCAARWKEDERKGVHFNTPDVQLSMRMLSIGDLSFEDVMRRHYPKEAAEINWF